jgi:hypothetical protein
VYFRLEVLLTLLKGTPRYRFIYLGRSGAL